MGTEFNTRRRKLGGEVWQTPPSAQHQRDLKGDGEPCGYRRKHHQGGQITPFQISLLYIDIYVGVWIVCVIVPREISWIKLNKPVRQQLKITEDNHPGCASPFQRGFVSATYDNSEELVGKRAGKIVQKAAIFTHSFQRCNLC